MGGGGGVVCKPHFHFKPNSVELVDIVLRFSWGCDNCLEIWKIPVPEFLKKLHLVSAGAVRKAGPDSMSILCLCFNL